MSDTAVRVMVLWSVVFGDSVGVKMFPCGQQDKHRIGCVLIQIQPQRDVRNVPSVCFGSNTHSGVWGSFLKEIHAYIGTF